MSPVADASCRPPSVFRIPSLKFVGLTIGRYGARCVLALMGLVTLTFNRVTLILVCESHLRWGTFLPNSGTLGLWVLELFAMYATAGRTKAALIVPFLTGAGHNNRHSVVCSVQCTSA